MAKKKKSAVKRLETPKVTSSFALLDIKTGRKKVAQLTKRGYRMPFVITGYTLAGESSVGNDDGVSIEFAAEVMTIDLGTPVLIEE